MYSNILIGLTVLFIVLIIYRTRSIESSLMTGFWKADARFSQESGLITMILYLGDSSLLGYRKGYIIAANEFGLILNHPITISFRGGYSLNPFMPQYKEYLIIINWDENEAPEHFPSQQTLYYYPTLGKIIMAHGTEIKAMLYKDGSLMDSTSVAPKKLINVSDGIQDDTSSPTQYDVGSDPC